MPDARRWRCKGGCGRTRADEPLSWTGLCAECGEQRNRENFVGLGTKSGPAFVRWRRAMAASVGGVLLDDVSKAP